MSPQFQLPFDDVAEGQLLPEGPYVVRVDGIKTKSKIETGNSWWELELTVIDGEHMGRKAWANVMLTHSAGWKMRQLALAAGLEVQGRTSIDTEELMNRELGIRVMHEQYQGEPRMRVKSFFNPRQTAAPTA